MADQLITFEFVFIAATSWIGSEHGTFFPSLLYNSNSLHLLKSYLDDLLYKVPAAQCSGTHLVFVCFEEGDSGKE